VSPAALDSVLLIAFGGPERPEDVRPFLEIVTAGRRIPPERIEEVAHHYELIGGRSPLKDLTCRQAEALSAALESEGARLPVYVGMRNWHPFLHETLAAMRDQGRRRALGIILSPFQTEASWERYRNDVATARARVGAAAPEVDFAPPWADHALVVTAMASRLTEALARVPVERRSATPVVFTAHSVPTASAERSPYVAQFEAAARAVAQRVGHGPWSLAYQSRSGPPREPWLEPDIAGAMAALSRAGARELVVAPIGFVCDHVEVLYDLDVEAAAAARALGITFHRASTANDHPAFIAMLADLVRRALDRPAAAAERARA
jgi:ferrochelatase